VARYKPNRGPLLWVVLTVTLALVQAGCVASFLPNINQTTGGGGTMGSVPPTAPPPAASSSVAPTIPDGPIAPPDGNSPNPTQAAWITVPASNTNPDALAVDVHFDYQCPYCGVLENQYAPLFDQLSDQGKIVLRHHARTFLDGVGGESGASSTKAAMAAACVDVVDNTLYAAYHNLIFTNQPQEGAGFTDKQLRDEYAGAVGLTGDALKSFQSCFDKQSTLAWVKAAEPNNANAKLNDQGTPMYLFGSNDPLCYDKQNYQQVDCSKDGAVQGGVRGTPTLLVNGVKFGLQDLFNSNFQPSFTSSDALMAFLQQKARG